MTEHEPTVRGRELGEGLRAALVTSGLAGNEVARKMDCSPSDISKMLSGKRSVKETDVARFLGVCRVYGAEAERLLALCREANKRGWYQQHGSTLPAKLRTYLDHEDKATALFDYAPTLLPGSLQTADYARAIISRIVNVPAEEIDDRVAARMARSAIFSRPRPARFTFFVHEFVLWLPVGEAAVMSDQLHHLLRMSVRPYLSLRMIPVAAGVHAGVEGSFTLMEFAGIKPVVYLENATTTVFLEEVEEISAYRHIIASLAETALPEEESRELIRNLTVELYGDAHA